MMVSDDDSLEHEEKINLILEDFSNAFGLPLGWCLFRRL